MRQRGAGRSICIEEGCIIGRRLTRIAVGIEADCQTVGNALCSLGTAAAADRVGARGGVMQHEGDAIASGVIAAEKRVEGDA